MADEQINNNATRANQITLQSELIWEKYQYARPVFSQIKYNQSMLYQRMCKVRDMCDGFLQELKTLRDTLTQRNSLTSMNTMADISHTRLDNTLKHVIQQRFIPAMALGFKLEREKRRLLFDKQRERFVKELKKNFTEQQLVQVVKILPEAAEQQIANSKDLAKDSNLDEMKSFIEGVIEQLTPLIPIASTALICQGLKRKREEEETAAEKNIQPLFIKIIRSLQPESFTTAANFELDRAWEIRNSPQFQNFMQAIQFGKSVEEELARSEHCYQHFITAIKGTLNKADMPKRPFNTLQIKNFVKNHDALLATVEKFEVLIKRLKEISINNMAEYEKQVPVGCPSTPFAEEFKQCVRQKWATELINAINDERHQGENLWKEKFRQTIFYFITEKFGNDADYGLANTFAVLVNKLQEEQSAQLLVEFIDEFSTDSFSKELAELNKEYFSQGDSGKCSKAAVGVSIEVIRKSFLSAANTNKKMTNIPTLS